MPMKHTLALLPLLATGLATAGQPLHDVLKLRTIEVVRCEAVTAENVAGLSRYVRAKSLANGDQHIAIEVAESVAGVMVEAVVKRQRDVVFPMFGRRNALKKAPWRAAENSDPLKFFVSTKEMDACTLFVPGERVNVVLSQKAECDTYPPEGLCAFDLPIRMVESRTWQTYGE